MLSYAEERDANIARNRIMLAELGVAKLKPGTEPKETRHKKKSKPSHVTNKRKANVDTESDDEKPSAKVARVANDENAVPPSEESTQGRRRSSRIAGKPSDALARVKQSRGTPQPISVKVLVEDTARPGKRVRRHDP